MDAASGGLCFREGTKKHQQTPFRVLLSFSKQESKTNSLRRKRLLIHKLQSVSMSG
jgi:hypothetical protein